MGSSKWLHWCRKLSVSLKVKYQKNILHNEFAFSVSIVQRFDTFWTGLQSPAMIVLPSDPNQPEPEIPEPPVIDGENIYNGCDDEKVCFGYPRGCLNSHDCDLFTAVRYKDKKFQFELLSSSQ